MTEQPFFAMSVSDVSASLAFLTEKLGFAFVEARPEEDLAYILDSDGDMLLLAGPGVGDVAAHLREPHFILHPGEHLEFGVDDLEARQAELLALGVQDFSLKENRVGDRMLVVHAPDSYTLHFIVQTIASFEVLVQAYAGLSSELAQALADLDESGLDLTRYAGGWSIRQIVHHLAESCLLSGQKLKLAISAPGTKVASIRSVGNERVSTEAEYCQRSVETSVALFRAFHAYFLDVIRYVPGVEAQVIMNEQNEQQTPGQLLREITIHAGEHIDEIWEIRRKAGLTERLA